MSEMFDKKYENTIQIYRWMITKKKKKKSFNNVTFKRETSN